MQIYDYDYSGIPRDRVLDFVMSDGSKLRGTLSPYWCGSDCPCGITDYSTDNCGKVGDPECWTVKGLDGVLSDFDPVEWSEI